MTVGDAIAIAIVATSHLEPLAKSQAKSFILLPTISMVEMTPQITPKFTPKKKPQMGQKKRAPIEMGAHLDFIGGVKWWSTIHVLHK